MRAQHRPTFAVRCSEESAFPGDDECLRHEDTNAADAARARNGHALQRRMILDVVGRIAMRDLPDEITFVQIDGCDPAIRRLHKRQSLNGHPTPTAFAITTASAAGAPPALRRSCVRISRLTLHVAEIRRARRIAGHKTEGP